jgi:GNAT acetyltransferase-like protein
VKKYTIKRYRPDDYQQWNAFIGKAKNATFLFHRDFMEYHSDRFSDFSLLVYDGDKLVSVLPANRVGTEVFSHQGLTYGGLITTAKTKLADLTRIFQSVLAFLESNEITALHTKTVPSIYHLIPAEELQYALFLTNSKPERRDALSVIDLQKPYSITKTRKESIRRGRKNGLVIKEETNFQLFWDEVLVPNLDRKHEAKPVHTVAEIEKLHRLFPENIRHFNVYHNGKIVAGTTVFISENVAHPQYVSGQPNKNELGSLDFLYHYLITDVFKDKRFFDFGISNEKQGRKLNEGLVFWKESFGARTITQDFYVTETASHKRLENFLI